MSKAEGRGLRRGECEGEKEYMRKGWRRARALRVVWGEGRVSVKKVPPSSLLFSALYYYLCRFFFLTIDSFFHRGFSEGL